MVRQAHHERPWNNFVVVRVAFTFCSSRRITSNGIKKLKTKGSEHHVIILIPFVLMFRQAPYYAKACCFAKSFGGQNRRTLQQ